MTFVQSDGQLLMSLGAPTRAAADSRVIPAGEAILLEPGTVVTLRLRDGTTLAGRFLGRTLLDSTLYAQRFAARSTSPSRLALGESLTVALRDGRTWAGAFTGYGEMALLLRDSAGRAPLRVPFEFAKEIRRANGDRVDPGSLARLFRADSLPSAEALAIGEREAASDFAQRWEGALRVPVEDIQGAALEVASHSNANLVIALGVFVGVVLLMIATSKKKEPQPSCKGPYGPTPTLLSEVHLTTRSFDLDRGTWIDDAPAMAAWPDSSGALMTVTGASDSLSRASGSS